MMQSIILFILALGFCQSRHLWAGASCYYLHGLKQADRLAVLDAFKDAGLKTVRIFVTHVYYNAKNTGNQEIKDLETSPG